MDSSRDKKEQGSSKEKLIIVMRHGERADLAGEEVLLHGCDPELTEEGKKQAYLAGIKLKELLEEIYGKNWNSKKIAFITSPFARCIVTAKYAKNGMNLCLPLYIENGLSEVISKKWFINSPVEFLVYHNSILEQNLEAEMEKEEHDYSHKSNKMKKKEVKVKFFIPEKPDILLKELETEIIINQSLNVLPMFPESDTHCITRIQTTLDLIIYHFGIRKEYDVIVLVTHMFGMKALLEKMKIPIDYKIEYCSTCLFKHNTETGKFTFEKSFKP
jgi:broad specificity phosphatase PhoE